MASLAKHLILCTTSSSGIRRHEKPSPAESDKPPSSATRRWTVAALAAALTARRPTPPPPAMAADAVPSWGTRSFVREKYFQPGLTAEEAAARIRQTAEGMRGLRPMLETMSWRYVLFYVRLKSAYLDMDLKTAMGGVPEGRRAAYVRAANELVDNMTELDRFVRSPKVYESYLYYEKALKSLDDVAAFFA